MTRTTPELAPLSPNFNATTGGRSATTYDLTCNRPHARRIFYGIGFELRTLRPQSQDLTTRPPRRSMEMELPHLLPPLLRKMVLVLTF
ncbi:hypothetical protein AVEN_234432-1 [Araneus ventricosus]|uniref:Uncharacterized protein n=1 Tax=Araneus ventricosus TaxID=182803 RepID=A0A4Y2A9C2_ARAVE|nr:hypothetical protein AVEN_234432-1 [Araneus ventricosus]